MRLSESVCTQACQSKTHRTNSSYASPDKHATRFERLLASLDDFTVSFLHPSIHLKQSRAVSHTKHGQIKGCVASHVCCASGARLETSHARPSTAFSTSESDLTVSPSNNYAALSTGQATQTNHTNWNPQAVPQR